MQRNPVLLCVATCPTYDDLKAQSDTRRHQDCSLRRSSAVDHRTSQCVDRGHRFGDISDARRVAAGESVVPQAEKRSARALHARAYSSGWLSVLQTATFFRLLRARCAPAAVVRNAAPSPYPRLNHRLRSVTTTEDGVGSHLLIGLTCVATMAICGITSFQPTLTRTYRLAPRQ